MDDKADISGDVDVFEFDLDLIARVFWKVKQQQFESIDLSKDIAEFTINDIHDTVYEELDEELDINLEFANMMSKIAECFIEDITLKSVHNSKTRKFIMDKKEEHIKKDDVALSLVITEEYDFLVSSLFPNYISTIEERGVERFYITCNVQEKKEHYIMTPIGERLDLDLSIDYHNTITLFPDHDDLKNGAFRFILSSGFDYSQRRSTIKLGGYLKLGDILISSIGGSVERQEGSKMIIHFKFNEVQSDGDKTTVFDGQGKATLFDDKPCNIEISFVLGDTNCTLHNLYVCAPLFHTTQNLQLDNKEMNLDGLNDAISGATSGALGVIAGHSLDTLKVRSQTSTASTMEVLKHMINHEGFRSFFKGMSVPLALSSFMSSTLFFAYGQAMSFQDQPQSGHQYYIAGTYAGIVQTFIETPLEHIKIKLQNQRTQKFTGPIQCTRHMYQEGGVRSLFKGFNVTMLRNAPSYGVYFATYEVFKKKLQMMTDMSPAISMFLAGGLGGVLSWVVIYPIDVVKTKIQSDAIQRPQFKSIKDCFIKTYRESGGKGFTKGLQTTLARTFIVSGVNFIGYEFTLKMLQSIQKG